MENKNLTVERLEAILRKYPAHTQIIASCGHCNHSSNGGEGILGVTDYTNQAYGYIGLNLNDAYESDVEANPNKEEFYKKEVEKLKIELNEKNHKLKYINHP